MNSADKRKSSVSNQQAPVYTQHIPQDNNKYAAQDVQVMPLHFQYNYLNKHTIPLHNEKYSIPDNLAISHAERKGFRMFENELDPPSHVILNHVSTWKGGASSSDEVSVASMTQRLNKSKYVTTIYYRPMVVQETAPMQVEDDPVQLMAGP